MEQERVFAVFGLGTFGVEVCRVLSEKGAEVIAVDKEQKLIDKVKDMVTQAVLLDSTEEDALRNAGVEDVDIAVIAMGSNLEASILTTVVLRNMGVPRIVARASSEIHTQVLVQVGATEVVNIEIEEGRRLADRIFAPDIMDVIPISQDQSIAEIRIPQEFVGKSLKELDIRNRYHVNIVSIKRVKTDIDEMGNPKREEQVFSPKPMDMLNVNDILVVLGTEKDINGMKEDIR